MSPKDQADIDTEVLLTRAIAYLNQCRCDSPNSDRWREICEIVDKLSAVAAELRELREENTKREETSIGYIRCPACACSVEDGHSHNISGRLIAAKQAEIAKLKSELQGRLK